LCSKESSSSSKDSRENIAVISWENLCQSCLICLQIDNFKAYLIEIRVDRTPDYRVHNGSTLNGKTSWSETWWWKRVVRCAGNRWGWVNYCHCHLLRS